MHIYTIFYIYSIYAQQLVNSLNTWDRRRGHRNFLACQHAAWAKSWCSDSHLIYLCNWMANFIFDSIACIILTQQMAAEVYDIAQRHLLVAIEYLKDAWGAAAIDYGGGCAAANARHGGRIHGRGQLIVPLVVAGLARGAIGLGIGRLGYAGLHLDGQAGWNAQTATHLIKPAMRKRVGEREREREGNWVVY